MHFALLYFYCDYYNDFSTSFHSFYSTVFKYVYKTFLLYVIEIFTYFPIIICINFLRIIFRIFHYFMFGCSFFSCLCIALVSFLLMFYMFFFCFLILAIIIHRQVLFYSYTNNIDKDANCLQSNNASSKNLWLLFLASFLFLKVWFNKSGNIT